MALKALMLRKKIDIKTKELEALRSTSEGFEKREAEIEAAIAEAASEEDQAAVTDEIDAFTAERAANAESITALEKEISELEAELEKEERSQETTPPPAAASAEREDVKMPETRNRFGITNEMVTREDVQSFLGEVRSCIREKRALSNAGLLIPDVYLGLIRENVPNFSKLYRHAYVRRLNGEGKLTIMGTIPQAVWTACCANLNELTLGFNEAVVDCNKVAAFVPVCNAILDDSDINLSSEILEAILISIGKALDLAILYGSGSGMPLGIYTRLAQESQPAGYPANARPWVDLHSTNILTIANSVTGIDLFKTIMIDSSVISGKYSRGEMVWVMNDKTYKFLRAQGMNINAAGYIVSAVDGQMPAVGGIVEVIDDVPDYNIIGGYFDLYLLAERQGITLETAPMVKFIEDETLFRGKARYDGLPVIAEGFCCIAINGASASAASLAADAANTVQYIALNKSAVTLATRTGTEQLTAQLLNAQGIPTDGTITWASSDDTKATVAGGKITGKAAGSAVITATCGNAVAVCNVTVP